MTLPAFIHLRTHSEYSVADSTLRIDDLVEAARADRQPAVALTDLANLFGLVKFYSAARAKGIKPIVGADVWITNAMDRSRPHRLLLLVQNQAGYLKLCELLTRAWLTNQHLGRPELRESWFDEGTDGLIALSGAQFGEVGAALIAGAADVATRAARAYAARFSGRFYIEVQRTQQAGCEHHVMQAVVLAAECGLPVVATHPVQFLSADDYTAHEARVCIAEGEILSNPRRTRAFGEDQYLKTQAEMAALFADLPAALENTIEIAQRCNVHLELGKPRLPLFPTPEGLSLDEYFRLQAQQGLTRRFAMLFESAPAEEVKRKYTDRLAFEIRTIIEMGFPGYFMIVADFINWAKNNGVPVGPGRGSGAGSLVAYSLGITDLDPLRYNLLFERFLNPERISMPDFDIDFCQDGRDRVIEYVRHKYGAESVSQIATFGTMAAKAAIRDVGRVLDLPYSFVDGIAKLVPFQPGKSITIRKRTDAKDDKTIYAREAEPQLEERERAEDDVAALLDLAARVEGLTRNVGMHAGGVLIAPGKLTDFCPLYVQGGATESQAGVISQFDKDDVESIGLVKFDFLGLTTLTILDWSVRYIRARGGDHAQFDLDRIPLDDPKAFAMFKTANTVAVFQFESRGMQEMLVRAQPDKFEDIIALVALYRPGPMDLIPSFCDRKHGRERVEYPDDRVRPILSETYGIMVYQEQVMQMAQIIGGYSLGSADLLRRAMGKKKPEEMAKHRVTFAEGAAKNGIAANKANEMFDLMEKFAGYGFNKSHAAAYALLAYQTAWLKAHYPAEFFAANMSCAMDDSDKVRSLWDDATRRNGLKVLPPDVNVSDYRFTPVSDKSIRYGLGGIKGTGEGAINAVVAARASGGAFETLFDFARRVDRKVVNKRTMEALARAGAFDALVADRARCFAAVEQANDYAEQCAAAVDQVSLFGDASGGVEAPPLIEAPPWSEHQKLVEEKSVFGFSLSGHLFTSVEREVRQIARTPLAQLKPSREPQTIAGVVTTVRLMSGKRGRMAIVTLDDSTAAQEVMVFGDAFDANRAQLVEDALLIIVGSVRQDDYSGGFRVTADRILTLAQARRQFAKWVRFSFVDSDGAAPASLFAGTDAGSNGLRVQIEVRNGSWIGALNLPDHQRVAADDAALRSAAAAARAARFEVVY